MNTMKIRYVCVPLLMSLSTASLANGLNEDQTSSERAAGTEFFLSDDSEGFQTRKLSAEFLPEYEDADHYLGVRGSAYQYRTDDWKRDGQKVSFIGVILSPLQPMAGTWKQGCLSKVIILY